ncbi:MAG: hypothetical protein WA373_02965 [Burkholderiales bacterium]
MHCHLLIPDFLAGAGTEAAGRLGAAETLVARGRRRRLAAIPSEQWLFERFEVPKQRDWPVAAYTLLADGGAPDEHFWLRADPVHLRFERDRLVLADSAVFDVSRAEAEALVETLNRHFGAAMLFYPLRPERWYVRPGRAPDMETIAPSAARGKAIDACLPAGADAMRFHALMNEAQMLLHEHPVNVEREARGEPAINSVWFWGGGVIDAPKVRPFSTVISDDPLASGLAQAAGISSHPLPGNAESLLAATAGEGVALIVLDALRQAAGYADAGRLREQRAALERDWLEPLLKALQSGRIGMLTLHLPDEDSLLEVEVARSDLRYFWRRRKPLAAYSGEL